MKEQRKRKVASREKELRRIGCRERTTNSEDGKMA